MRLIGLWIVPLWKMLVAFAHSTGKENFALLRRLALNALNQEQTYKRSLKQKMKRAAMDDSYMIQVLNSCFIDLKISSSQPLCQA
jgi:hypothetical protein